MIGVQFDKKDIVRVDKSSALPQLAESLWTQFQKVLWASQSDPYGDSARACRRAWNLLDVIYRVLALGPPDTLSRDTMWILGVYRKIQSRASIVPQDHSSNAFAGLPVRQAPRFRFTIFSDPTDPGWVWWHQIMWESDSHTSKDFDWLVDFLHEVYSKDHETAGDILVLLSSMWASCSPTKQHLYVKKLIACMGSSMPPRLRHAALLAAHSSREVLASINVVDDALSLAILTAVCPQPGVTSTDGPDRFFHYNRDLCYLELIFALARNSYWRPHLCCQIDRAIRMITVCCESYAMHTFYLAGIFLRMTSEQVSSFSSITEQQWWDMMRKAWPAFLIIDSTRCVKLLPVLVEGTKKYMYIASKSDLEVLIEQVDNLIGEVEMRDLLEQIEGVEVAVQELRGMANDMLVESS
ncbi:hypothetical protein BD769DRAFT_1441448 [Suillus cothurnatus]|nr:hypothetical protein BD769DRAFT_1441448 [Suillus cothurnatus]